jgi:hypothetical protein
MWATRLRRTFESREANGAAGTRARVSLIHRTDYSRNPSAKTAGFRAAADDILNRWLVFLAAWVPTLTTVLVLKHVLLLEGGYWSTALVSGLSADNRAPAEAFTLLQKLTFYRWDLAVWAVLIPLMFAALSRIVTVRPLLIGIIGANVALVAWLWIQRIAWLFTGRFLTWALIRDGATWAARHHHDLALYAPPSVAAKAAAAAVLGVVFPLVALYFKSKWGSSNAWRILSRGTLGFVLAVLLPAFGPWLSRTVFQSNTFSIIARFTSSTTDSLRLAHASGLEIETEFHKLADSPELRSYASPYHGKARGFDVIIWVCETLPARAVAARGGITHFPNFGRLAKSSLVSDLHYSPSGYSSSAGFSLLTSMYPPNSLEWIFRAGGKGRVRQIEGLLSELQRMNYETEVFFPGDASFDSDLELVRVAGAKRIFVSDLHQQTYNKTSWQRRLRLDEIAFAELKREVANRTGNGERYAAVFFPEIGHAPWENVTGLPGSPARLQLGDALVGLQDRWFGELIDLLIRQHRLNKTVIVATGDHGIRTLKEDPDLPRAMLDDYTFHVPLLLYAPGVFSTEAAPRPEAPVRGVTSHVDIAPSLLDLLGAAQQPSSFQGLPFWDPGIAQRKVFFLGASTVGANGYHFLDHFYSVQALTGLVFGNTSMHFTGAQLLSESSARSVTAVVDALTGLQGDWTERAAKR